MKRVLIIGDNSYIAKSFEKFAKNEYRTKKNTYDIKMVNSRNGAWKNVDFNGYDSVLHCAGIAHVSHDPKMESLYYEINCDLAVDVAKKAKSEGVRQFIFLSSILVYGSSNANIDKETLPNPDNFYGSSKLKAEQELQQLADELFKLCIIRVPTVYGKGCKGNYPKLVKLAKITSIFPNYPSRRSMIHIDNLCKYLCGLINNEVEGVFLPQNKEHVNMTALVKLIASHSDNYVITTKLFNPIIRLLIERRPAFKKMFGDLYYAKQGDEDEYNIMEFENSVWWSIFEIKDGVKVWVKNV